MTELPDHIGWALHQAYDAWKGQFRARMVSAGFPWYAEARGALLRFLTEEGVAQSELAARAGMTRQAVQQHLDDLVRDGVAERRPDPDDARRNLIVLGPEGLAAKQAATRIKEALETQYREALGADRFAALGTILVDFRRVTEPS